MAEERKMEFAGNGVIKKCPNCGAQLEAFQARCPACGFAIGGEEKGGTTSLQTFMEKYLGESDNARKLDMINMFPIPNTVEDTIEFAILAVQQIKSYAIRQKEAEHNKKKSSTGLQSSWNKLIKGNNITDNDFLIAWKNKLEQVCQRAKIAYPQDRVSLDHLDMLVKDAENAVSAFEKEKKGKKKKKIIIVAIVIACYVVTGVIFKLKPDLFAYKELSTTSTETTRLERLATKIQTDIAEGNYDAAELKLLDFKWTYDRDESQISIWEEKKALLVKQLESKKEGNK